MSLDSAWIAVIGVGVGSTITLIGTAVESKARRRDAKDAAEQAEKAEAAAAAREDHLRNMERRREVYTTALDAVHRAFNTMGQCQRQLRESKIPIDALAVLDDPDGL